MFKKYTILYACLLVCLSAGSLNAAAAAHEVPKGSATTPSGQSQENPISNVKHAKRICDFLRHNADGSFPMTNVSRYAREGALISIASRPGMQGVFKLISLDQKPNQNGEYPEPNALQVLDIARLNPKNDSTDEYLKHEKNPYLHPYEMVRGSMKLHRNRIGDHDSDLIWIIESIPACISDYDRPYGAYGPALLPKWVHFAKMMNAAPNNPFSFYEQKYPRDFQELRVEPLSKYMRDQMERNPRRGDLSTPDPATRFLPLAHSLISETVTFGVPYDRDCRDSEIEQISSMALFVTLIKRGIVLDDAAKAVTNKLSSYDETFSGYAIEIAMRIAEEQPKANILCSKRIIEAALLAKDCQDFDSSHSFLYPAQTEGGITRDPRKISGIQEIRAAGVDILRTFTDWAEKDRDIASLCQEVIPGFALATQEGAPPAASQPRVIPKPAGSPF